MANPGTESAGSSNSVQAVIDALYRDFLLRDLFAKIVPGSIVLLTLAGGIDIVSMGSTGLLQPGLAVVVVFAGAAWLTGFGIQGLGEITHLIRHHPKDGEYDDSSTRYDKRIEFKLMATRSEVRRVERYAIIKEAAGNGGTAVVLVCSMIGVRWLLAGLSQGAQGRYFLALSWMSIAERAVTGIVILLLAVTLLYTNRTHATKQYEYMERVLDRHAPLE